MTTTHGWFLEAGRGDLLPADYDSALDYGVGDGDATKAFVHFGILKEIVRYLTPNYGDYSVSEYEQEI